MRTEKLNDLLTKLNYLIYTYVTFYTQIQTKIFSIHVFKEGKPPRLDEINFSMTNITMNKFTFISVTIHLKSANLTKF